MHSQNYNVIDAGIYAKRDYLTCPFFEQEMLKLLYYLWIWSIGLTLIGTLIYGLVNFPPDTITQHMIDQVEYIIILSACMILQAILIFIYTWAKRNQNKEVILYKYVFLSSIVISRIVLSNILTTATHLVFVYICLCSLFIILLRIYFYPPHYKPQSIFDLPTNFSATAICLCIGNDNPLHQL